MSVLKGPVTGLDQLITNGETAAAQDVFAAARASGDVDVYHWYKDRIETTMLHNICDSATEQQKMLKEMAEAGVEPDSSIYTILVQQLMFEGKSEEAEAVVETEMPAAGVVPNDRTLAIIRQ